jgi:hypothetical protein
MVNIILICLILAILWAIFGFKKPFGYQRYTQPGDLRKDCLVLFVSNENGNGITVFLPWMIHGPYTGLCSNKREYGWRCLRLNIVFFIRFQGKIVAPVKLIPFWEAV